MHWCIQRASNGPTDCKRLRRIVFGWAEILFPSTNISQGATLNIGDWTQMNLGTLSGGGKLNITGIRSNVKFTGDCARLNLDQSIDTRKWRHFPNATIGSGSKIGTLYQGRGQITVEGKLSVESLTLASGIFVNGAEGTPIIVKKRLSLNRKYANIGLIPYIYFREWGHSVLKSEFVVIDNQGTEPIHTSVTDRSVIEGHEGVLEILTADGRIFQDFKLILNGGDGNDLSMIPLP
jgi:hypothetical protein